MGQIHILDKYFMVSDLLYPVLLQLLATSLYGFTCGQTTNTSKLWVIGRYKGLYSWYIYAEMMYSQWFERDDYEKRNENDLDSIYGLHLLLHFRDAHYTR